jgi:hypothetical protein
MKILNLSLSTYFSNNEKIYISKEVYNKAKEITSQGKEALVYDNKVLALNKETISELSDSFRGDIKSWNGIYFATGKAKNYVQKISDFVLNDLGVKEADKNRDGIISPKEKIEAKSMLYNNQLVKPAYVLSTDELLEFIKHQKSESIDEIIDENIQIDKNRDGKVTVDEIVEDMAQRAGSGDRSEDILEKLQKELEKLQKELGRLNQELQLSVDDNRKEMLLKQIRFVSTKMNTVIAEIEEIMEQLSKMN